MRLSPITRFLPWACHRHRYRGGRFFLWQGSRQRRGCQLDQGYAGRYRSLGRSSHAGRSRTAERGSHREHHGTGPPDFRCIGCRGPIEGRAQHRVGCQTRSDGWRMAICPQLRRLFRRCALTGVSVAGLAGHFGAAGGCGQIYPAAHARMGTTGDQHRSFNHCDLGAVRDHVQVAAGHRYRLV